MEQLTQAETLIQFIEILENDVKKNTKIFYDEILSTILAQLPKHQLDIGNSPIHIAVAGGQNNYTMCFSNRVQSGNPNVTEHSLVFSDSKEKTQTTYEFFHSTTTIKGQTRGQFTELREHKPIVDSNKIDTTRSKPHQFFNPISPLIETLNSDTPPQIVVIESADTVYN